MTNTSHRCEICSESFVGNHIGPQNKRFCSKRCASTSFNRRRAEEKRLARPATALHCKVCTKEFARVPGASGRPQRFCSDLCQKKQWNLDHPDAIKISRKKIYAKNGAAIRAKSAEWGRANPERAKERNRAWSKTEKGKLTGKAGVHRRRARIMGAGGSFTRAEFKALCTATGNVCLCCRKAVPFGKLEADHIVALVNGGDNSIGNIQPLCRHCNADKGKKTMNFILDYALEGMVLNDPREYGAFQGAAL